MAVQSDVMEATGPYDRAKALNAFKLGDTTFYWITRACAISVLLILGGIILSLIAGAWPAMHQYGIAFLWTQRWAPSADPPVLGALGPMYGTLVTSFIAMLIAIPVGLGIAICARNGCAVRSGLRSNCSPESHRSSTGCGGSSCLARSWPIRFSRS
jgi:phosphate transport system permease protein